MSENKDNLVPFKKLTAAEIFAVEDIKTIDVEVPDWKGVVTLRSLTADEAVEFGEMVKQTPNAAPVFLLVTSAVDSEGKRLFTNEDVKMLRKKSLRAMMVLQNAALDLNGLKDTKKALEAAKND